jgi:hypothetical protein
MLFPVFIRRHSKILFKAIAEIMLIAVAALLRNFKNLHRGAKQQITCRPLGG